MKTPLAYDAYETLADAYAAVVETKPHNAFYDRPGTLALLPDVRGLRVLDAGCGPGVYSERLIARGASVVSIDVSPRMAAHARQRLGPDADVRVMDLGQPLTEFEDGAFDLVLSPLVLDYLEDWRAVFAEFFRILTPGGGFVFSVEHPFSKTQYFQSDNYFATERVQWTWKGFPGVRVEMPSIRRPLSAMTAPLLEAGFQLETLSEPLPTDEFRQAMPDDYAEILRRPAFIAFRARKPERKDP